MFGYFFGRMLWELFAFAVKATYWIVALVIAAVIYSCVAVVALVGLTITFLKKRYDVRQARISG